MFGVAKQCHQIKGRTKIKGLTCSIVAGARLLAGAGGAVTGVAAAALAGPTLA